MYIALHGSGAVLIHGEDGYERLPLEPGRVVAVGPSVERSLVSGPGGLRAVHRRPDRRAVHAAGPDQRRARLNARGAARGGGLAARRSLASSGSAAGGRSRRRSRVR
jgi:hypothetical protein